MIHVFDADSLWHMMNIKNIEHIDFANSQFILTPNKVEFIRLYDKFFKDKDTESDLFDNDYDYDQEQFYFFEFLNEKKSKFFSINFLFTNKN
jgi:NAD(P)H-hydrate repair Nnr-like enzyme with NAD(P)H-hydrate dehydratase domain